ncbi:MAG: glycosyltransferase [Candidatus Marinimicrobia bacterium]|nr:glycosyltransferase [Candidatus Neomarinimicrobiota bacterium]
MKVLILSALAQNTGSAVRTEFIAESLKKAGVEVDFVKPFPRTFPFKIDFIITLPWYFLRIIFSSAKFVFVVKSYPNVVLPLFFKKLLGGKIIIDTDDLSFAYSEGRWSYFSELSQELFLPLADLHTYHHPNLLNYLTKDLKISSKKTYQLKQGVNLKIFEKELFSKAKDRLKRKLGLEKKKILIFVGHFDVACDLEEILKAMVQVFQEDPRARLLLVGDGERRKEFQELAQELGIFERIVWIGLVPKEKVADFVSLADVCLVYYGDKQANYFRTSMKLREYLAMGKRVVCNDVGELKDFEKYTYQTSSQLSDFAKMTIKVLSGFGDRREEKGRIWVKRNYSWEEIGRDFAEKLRNYFAKK